MATTEGVLRQNFAKEGLAPPHVHKGFFKDIPEAMYPSQIAFAFFDGDLYSSITDSFNMVYKKLSPGARVMLHDYKWSKLPGVEKATVDFLVGKPDEREDCQNGVGRVIKA